MNNDIEELAARIRQKLNAEDFRLPALPDTVIKVQKLMANDNYAVADISKILQRDNAFATVVLRMANSVRFNTSGKEIRNLDMAIQRIGPAAILQLLIGVANRLVFNVKQPELRKILKESHEHALLVSATAEETARVSGAANPADTFMAGLLHDQGKDVLLIAIADELLEASPDEREALVDMFHKEMGARLLHKWSLPEEFVLIAQHHGIESPDRPSSAMLDCIDVADALVDNMTEAADAGTDAANMPAAKRLRLNEAKMNGIIVDVEDTIEELRQTFAA